jgi:hypothetical protein
MVPNENIFKCSLQHVLKIYSGESRESQHRNKLIVLKRVLVDKR